MPPRPARPAATPPAVFAPATLGPLTLRNRIIKAATFEGVMPGGTVSDALIDFHRRVAAGGAAMSTVAYLAVSPEGRTDRHCLLLNKENLPGLRRLTDAVHAEGAAAAAQIGHAGPVANARSNGAPALSPSGGLTPMGSRLRAVDASGIERITDDYRRAAALAVEAGFDSIEVHVGHNYLLSAFLSPKLNRRDDQFGGIVENRARFARARPAHRTRRRRHRTWRSRPSSTWPTASPAGSGSTRASKWPPSSRPTARSMRSSSPAAARSPTRCTSSAATRRCRSSAPPCPRPVRHRLPVRRPPLPQGLPVRGGLLPALRPPVPGRALHSRSSSSAASSELDTIEAALAEGFAFVAMARALLREPDLPSRMQAGTAATSLCIHCNKCMPTIYSGTRCVLVPDRPVPA